MKSNRSCPSFGRWRHGRRKHTAVGTGAWSCWAWRRHWFPGHTFLLGPSPGLQKPCLQLHRDIYRNVACNLQFCSEEDVPTHTFFLSRSVAHSSQLKSIRATGWPVAAAEMGRELTVTIPKGWSEQQCHRVAEGAGWQ